MYGHKAVWRTTEAPLNTRVQPAMVPRVKLSDDALRHQENG
jgi:hypothetical protein